MQSNCNDRSVANYQFGSFALLLCVPVCLAGIVVMCDCDDVRFSIVKDREKDVCVCVGYMPLSVV